MFKCVKEDENNEITEGKYESEIKTKTLNGKYFIQYIDSFKILHPVLLYNEIYKKNGRIK